MRRTGFAAALALLPLLSAPAWSAETDYEELSAEYDEARGEYSRELRALYGAEERDMDAILALQKQNPVYAFVPRFQAGAEEVAGQDAAVPFLAWIVLNGAPGGSEEAEPALAALSTLQTAHLESEALGDVIPRMRYSSRTLGEEACLEFFDAVVTGSPHAVVRANALFNSATIRLSGDPSEEVRAKAIADMRRVMVLAPDSDVAARAEGSIFQAERLQLGMVAPDIVGEDLLGVEFKLSDYRGKVVVLDFWGDW